METAPAELCADMNPFDYCGEGSHFIEWFTNPNQRTGYDAGFEPRRNFPPLLSWIFSFSRNRALGMTGVYDPEEMLVDQVILEFHFLKPLDNTASAQT